MKIGDIVYLTDNRDINYIVLATKDCQEKQYALVTPFDAKINFKQRKIKDVNIDLKKAILISVNKVNKKVQFESDKKIISDLCKIIYRKDLEK